MSRRWFRLKTSALFKNKDRPLMGWEFAAVWVDDPDQAWRWVWRRVADDSGDVLAQSGDFPQLDQCIADARRNGFDASDCDTE